YHGALPPTIKVDQPNPKMGIDGSPFHVGTTLRPWIGRHGARRAGVSAFGFGGSNFHAVIESPREMKGEPAWDGSIQIIALSGARREDIVAQIDALRAMMRAPHFDAAQLAYAAQASRHAFDATAACRLLIVAGAD